MIILATIFYAAGAWVLASTLFEFLKGGLSIAPVRLFMLLAEMNLFFIVGGIFWICYKLNDKPHSQIHKTP